MHKVALKVIHEEQNRIVLKNLPRLGKSVYAPIGAHLINSNDTVSTLDTDASTGQ